MAHIPDPIRVLLLEDSADDAELNVLELTKGRSEVVWKRVETADAFRAALAHEPWDVILSDHSMPGFGAGDGLRIARGVDADLPFIVVSGTIGEESAVAMLKAGANDYLLKGNLLRLGHAVERALEDAATRRAHRKTLDKAALLASIVSTTDDAIISTSPRRIITSWNPGAERMFGWTEQEAVGKSIAMVVPPDKLDELAGIVARLTEDRRHHRFDTVRLRRDGTRVDVAVTLSPMLDASGQVVGYSKVACDITRRLATESALTASRGRLEHAQAIAHVGSWVSGFLPDGAIEMSRECAAIFGVPELKRLPLAAFFELIHPGDRDRFRAATHASIDDGAAAEIEHRLLLPDGRVRWVFQRGVVERDHEGAPLRFVGSVQDVTLRHVADERVRASEAELRALAESMPQIVWITTPDGSNTYFNQQWVEYTGLTLEESHGAGWNRPFHPDDKQLAWEAWQNAVAGRGAYSVECRLRRADGAYRWWLIRGLPVTDPHGAILKWFGTCTDIDSLKQAEGRLRVLHQIAESLRTAPSARAGLEAVLRSLGRHLGASGCAYMTVEPDGDHVTIPVEYLDRRPALGDRLRLSAFGAGFVARLSSEGEPFVVHDVDGELVPESAAALRELDVQAFVVCPLMKDGALRALFVAHQTSPRAWTRAEIELFGEVVQRCWAEVQRSDVERALHESEALLRIAGRAAHLGGWTLSIPDLALTWSDEVCSIHEVPIGSRPSLEHAIGYYAPEFRTTIEAAIQACMRAGTPFDVELQIVTASGRRVWVRQIGKAERDVAGRIVLLRGAFQDIDDRRRLQDQYRQAQKMEAVGRLAAGVAHDFNNLLTVILSYTHFCVEDLAPENPLHTDIREINNAALRATALTKQLLAFSRQQVFQARVMDLNETVTGMEGMLRRLIGEDIKLVVIAQPSVRRVFADPNQIEQVVMNLAVNARDAMPDGGTLTIETADVHLDEAQSSEKPGACPGDYVVVTVTDTGVGMDAVTQARIFEPFFTTKGLGLGTGLGLSTAFGIMAQSGGHIRVDSEAGRGTSFRLYLPRTARMRTMSSAPMTQIPRGMETVLLVEDDPQLRRVASTILRRGGYVVLEAAEGEAACVVAREHGAAIHLLLTDVVMPGMNGRKLAETLAPLRPDMKVLFASGYTDDAIVHHGVLDGKLRFIQKPFTSEALLRKVRDVLDRSPSIAEVEDPQVG